MTDQRYTVLLFDKKHDTRTFLTHNLSEDEADEEVSRLRSEGLPAFHISYATKHDFPDAETCRDCTNLFPEQRIKGGNGYDHTMV